MDRRDFLKTLAAAGALVTVKTSGMMDVMASTMPANAMLRLSEPRCDDSPSFMRCAMKNSYLMKFSAKLLKII